MLPGVSVPTPICLETFSYYLQERISLLQEQMGTITLELLHEVLWIMHFVASFPFEDSQFINL